MQIGSDATMNYGMKLQQLMFSTLDHLYQNLLSFIFWITGEFITLSTFATNFMSSHRPLTASSATLKTTLSFTTILTTVSYQYISNSISSSFVLGIMEMPLLLKILLSGLEFQLAESKNLQIVSLLLFFHVMIKQFISPMLQKRSAQICMLIKLCVLNGVAVFCQLMNQNSHFINIQGCMAMHGLIRMECTLLIVRCVYCFFNLDSYDKLTIIVGYHA